MSLLLTGCNNAAEKENAGADKKANPTGYPRTVTVRRGNEFTLNAEPKRIVSLAPSFTELAYALGLGDRIVGDTTACDYPPEAKNKPHISGAGGQIDIEKVKVANPDLVLAIASINKKAIDSLQGSGIPVLWLDVTSLDDTYIAIKLLGQATGTEEKAKAIESEMRNRIQQVQNKTRFAKTRPKILIMYGDAPIYTTGPDSFISDLIRIAGGQNIVKENLPNNIISAEKVLLLQPDVILCDKELQTTVKGLPGWATGVPAVKNSRFFSESAQASLVRPSPRLAQGIEELARYLHPELFPTK